MKYDLERSAETVRKLSNELASPTLTRPSRRRMPPLPEIDLTALIAGQLPIPTMDNSAFTPAEKKLFGGNARFIDMQAKLGVLVIDQFALNDPTQVITLMEDMHNIGIYQPTVLIPEITPQYSELFISQEEEILSELMNKTVQVSLKPAIEEMVRGNARFYLAAAQRLREGGGPKLTLEKGSILETLGVQQDKYV
jgi:hypothetical protein